MSVRSRRARRRKLKNEINVVPYIDVMLVLLIIFMVTAPLMNLGVDVQLPESNAKSIQEKKDPVVVSVDADGHYFLAVEAGSNEAVDAASLNARVRAIVASNPQVAVFIAADGNGSYQNVMDAMALLQNAGVERVGLMSNPRQDGPR
ncbi:MULTISPECIES: protein TolR [unclassified Luteimonas]|uniref:protein TolR n=1 Tax=unclassified Luteimonas TaxID=2629088 RepID=UPI001603B46A|nr:MULTISPECIES: protein TolR [unclassified Luteimonas]MBB1473811.1 protein TolR [Luteimonas sp. MC1782]MBB6599957.1 protein TolR [Luteimonas sp. MC1825]QOC87664.1 protein TolR [Luteimonas sp. MC1825]